VTPKQRAVAKWCTKLAGAALFREIGGIVWPKLVEWLHWML
jgi:hypothetical protein